MRRFLFAALLPFIWTGCGDDSNAPGADAGPDGCHHVCGDGVMQCNEQCDDGNNASGDGCSADCKIECGDGVKQAGEKCDTAIPAGMPGACPTSCDDQNACTTDTLSGSLCQQDCVNGAITACQGGDGCCPTACNSGNDSDCTSTCGNGVVETGETCDTGITSGPGKCPTMADCNDNQVCTTDTLANGGTCTAACMNTPITACMNGDGCCPPGCTSANDNNCSATCGNGVVDPGETCDTAIPAGSTGACPTSCNDNNACTTDTLLSGGTCMAVCNHVAITTCTNGDGCCPSTCNANNDNNCQPRCGNGVIEAGEQCDDGNTTNGDGCSSTCQTEPTAFRVTQAFIRDPHIWVTLPFFLGCQDVTDSTPLGASNSANGQLNARITMDTMPMDGFFDLSILAVFNPLQQSQMTNAIQLITQANCTAANPTSCTPRAGATIVNGTATNHTTGTCLGIIPNTVRPWSPPVMVPGASCFDSDSHDITLPVAGAMITLHGSQAAATYSGNPATQLINGEIRGFLTESDANNTNIMIMAVNYNGPLAGLLPGGVNNCHEPSPMAGDKDMGPDANGNMVSGWWFYVNYAAAKAPYTP